MPKLDDIMLNRPKKKFVKKEYRPWDLKGEGTAEPEQNNLEKKATISESDKKTANSVVDIKPKITDSVEKVTKREQKGNKKVTPVELEVKNNDIPVINQRVIKNTDVKSLALALTGIQKLIVEFIVYICSVNNSNQTGPILTIDVADYANTSVQSIKTSIVRLAKKGIIERLSGKRAAGGYINLYVSDEVKDIFLSSSKKNDTTSGPAYFIKSISNKINNDFLRKEVESSNLPHNRGQLPEEWSSINLAPLSDIGLSTVQIKQLSKLNIITPELVQESIYHFAFGLHHNKKVEKYTDPLNVFMGVLRKGDPWVETNYISPQDRAQKELNERKKIEIEARKKLHDEAYKIALADWKDGLSPNEIKEIAPEKKKMGEAPQEARLNLYFKANIWPNIKSKYLIS